MPDERKLLRVGVVGAVLAALCCLTPVLVILFGALGLSAVTGYLDYVLVPAFAAFLGLVAYALYRRRCATKTHG